MSSRAAVAAGDPILSPGVTRRLLDRVTAEAGTHDEARAALRVLSPREHEVAVAVARGPSNADIAEDPGMTVAGRRSGRRHSTVLDVVHRDPAGSELVVVSGFGPRADRLRHLDAGGPPSVSRR